MRILADAQFSIGPRAVQMVRALLVSSVTVGAINTVTAVTGDLKVAAGSAEGVSGKEFQLALTPVDGAGINPRSYKIVGDLPPGLELTAHINEGSSSISFADISGIPTQAGTYDFTVQAFQGFFLSFLSGNPLPVSIVIAEGGVQISKEPKGKAVGWGGGFELTVEVNNSAGVSYQWQKRSTSDVTLYEDLVGETDDVLAVDEVLSVDEGVYRVVVSDASRSIISEQVFVNVLFSSYQVYRETNFNNPFAVEAAPLNDADNDGRTNLEEHHFGLNPLIPDTVDFPKTSREMINEILYVVMKYPAKMSDNSFPIIVEENEGLSSADWTEVTGGIIVEDTDEAYIIKAPVMMRQFCRLKFVLQ